MVTTKLRKRDTGEQGNGGQFAKTARPDAPIPVPAAATEQRTITLFPNTRKFVDHLGVRYDAEGRTVVLLQMNRKQLVTSGYRLGTNPWDFLDADVSDEVVDEYLEQCSDDPETFGDELGFPGEARWISASSTLELTYTGYEGISDCDLTSLVGTSVGDFRRVLLLREWPDAPDCGLA